MYYINKHTLCRKLSTSCLIAFLLLFSTAFGLVTQAGADNIEAELTAMQNQSFNDEDIIISLEFPGGNAMEYLEALQHKVPKSNIIIMNDVDKVEMPEIRLKSVTLYAAMQLLEDQSSFSQHYQYELSFDELSNGSNSEPIYIIRAYKTRVSNQLSDNPVSLSKIWAVEPLLQVISSDDILAAIDVALPLSVNQKPDVELRFHKETGLLIARGGEHELRMIDQLLNELNVTASGRVVENRRQDSVNELEIQNNELLQRMQEMQPIIQTQQQMIENLQQALQAREEMSMDMQNRMRTLTDKLKAMQKELEIHRDK